MASESTEEETLSVTLPAELDDWLEERAAALDADRETVLVQLLASYRATAELDAEYDATNGQGMPVADSETVENAVRSVLADTLDDRVESAVQATVRSAVEGRFDGIQDDYMEKIEDVRERVIQLKRELDTKAAADHHHDELGYVAELTTRLDDVESGLNELRDDLDSRLSDGEDTTEDIEQRLDAVHDRLKTVAWVVSDLREAHENGGMEAVDRLKRAAAQANVDYANCENCGETVSIGLMTEPNCPHCRATVTNVKPSSGFFSKPRLLTASQLEAGENDE